MNHLSTNMTFWTPSFVRVLNTFEKCFRPSLHSIDIEALIKCRRDSNKLCDSSIHRSKLSSN